MDNKSLDAHDYVLDLALSRTRFKLDGHSNGMSFGTCFFPIVVVMSVCIRYVVDNLRYSQAGL